MRKFNALITLILVLSCFACQDQDFEEIFINDTFTVNDIHYEVTSTSPYEVKVIQKSPIYEGEISIPENVSYRDEDLSVTMIDEAAFHSCNGLLSIVLPNSIKVIGGGAFIDCTNLKTVNLPQSLTLIEDATFCRASGLVSIDIPNSVKIVSHSAFIHCTALKDVTIGDSVEVISSYAFGYCTSLKTLYLGKSVTLIDGLAFIGSSNLAIITCAAETPPSLDQASSSFEGVPLSTPVYVPEGSVELYKSHRIWKYFENIQPIEE